MPLEAAPMADLQESLKDVKFDEHRANTMRLSTVQIETLKRIAAEVFGPQAGLMLFGSRADDTLRGGDIDLYVSGADAPLGQRLDEKLLFLVKAKQALGDQRIDVVFAPTPHQQHLPIHREAERTGIVL